MKQFTKNLALQHEMTGRTLQPATAAMIVQTIINANVTEEQAIQALARHMMESDRPALPMHIIKLVHGNPEQAATDAANEAYGRFLQKLEGYNPDIPRRCMPLDHVTESVVRTLFGGWDNAMVTLTAKDLQDGTIRAQFRNAWLASQNVQEVTERKQLAGKHTEAITGIANSKRIG